MCVTVVTTVPAAEAGVLLVRGNIQREAVDTADSTMLILFLPYSSLGNHGYRREHDHLMVWKSASCVFILVWEACGTRRTSHWAITLLLPPWGGWLKGMKKNQESEQRMMRRVCTKMGNGSIFPLDWCTTWAEKCLISASAAEDVEGGAAKEGVSKTKTAEGWHWSSLTRKPEELWEYAH